jgi:SAM-dependent methyltransferase
MSSGELDRRIAERAAADRRYNDALTAVDRSLPSFSVGPSVGDDTRPLPTTPSRDPGTGAPPSRRGWRGRLARFIWRTMGPALAQQDAWNEAAADHAAALAAALQSLERTVRAAGTAHRQDLQAVADFQSQLVQYLQQITPFIDTKTRVLEASVDELRMAATAAQRTAVAVRREVERLAASARESRPAPGGDTSTSVQTSPATSDAIGYAGFEDLFRGSSEEIRRRQEADADRFRGAADVLDIGCGRGEFLELLRERGVKAIGVDVNREMVDICRARDLDAHHADALTFLAALPDASLGGLMAAQVVEHLQPAYLVRLIDVAGAKLRPGAPIVLETINVACWVAFFESYIRDITHVRPLHPETLKFLVVAAGFEQVDVHFRSPISPEGRLQMVDEAVPADLLPLVRAFNANVGRLNDRLFTHLDYAVIGARGR